MAKGGRPFKVDPRIEVAYRDIDNCNNETVIALLQELGVDAYDGYKRTVLINSAFYGNLNLLHWCINNGSDINFQDKLGMSALHFASQEGRIDVAQILIDNGAEINIQDIHGRTPLLTATLNWRGGTNIPIILLLIQNGADPHLKNFHGVCAYGIMSDELKSKVKEIRG